MPTAAQILGRFGETLAEEYFTLRGDKILARNFIADFGELDLLVLHDAEIIAVEVKTRNVRDLAEPEEYVGRWKLRRMLRALRAFASEYELFEHPWHMDMIAIQTDDETHVVRFTHIRDIWPP